MKKRICFVISGGIIAILFFWTIANDLVRKSTISVVINVGIFTVLFFVINTFLKAAWDLIRNCFIHNKREAELEVRTEHLVEKTEELERRTKRLKKRHRDLQE